MKMLTNFPVVIFVVSVVILYSAAYFGKKIAAKAVQDEAASQGFDIVMGATLTLLGLIIGFTFSMAVSRYDQRKNYEEEEANAIGTEYLRLDFLPAPQANEARRLLEEYLQRRIEFYTSRNANDSSKNKRRNGANWRIASGRACRFRPQLSRYLRWCR